MTTDSDEDKQEQLRIVLLLQTALKDGNVKFSAGISAMLALISNVCNNAEMPYERFELIILTLLKSAKAQWGK